MGFVCSRTSVANSIFSLILRRPISWRPQDTGRQLNHRRRHRHSGTFRSSESCRNSPCIVLFEQRHVSSTQVHSGLVSQVSWHGRSGIDRVRGACCVAMLWWIVFLDI